MRSLSLSAIPLCRHECTFHQPSTASTVLQDSFSRVGRAFDRGAASVASALSRPVLGGFTYEQVRYVVLGVFLGTSALFHPLVIVQLCGSLAVAFIIGWVQQGG